MKKLLSVLLSLVMMLLCACGAPSQSEETEESTEAIEYDLTPLCDGKTLKVLAIGNSFSNNTTEYLYDIAMAEGMTDVVIGRIYFGACSVQRHASNARNNTAEYTYYKNNSGEWTQTENATMLQGLQDEDWDIITLQQSSGSSGLPGTYDGCLQELINYVNENKTNPDAKLVWHMTWAYQADSDHKDFSYYANDQQKMYEYIGMTVQQVVLPTSAFSAVIPAGTAIQNARTSYFGDNLTEDGYHLNILGMAVASYTWYAMLTGKPLETINLTDFGGVLKLSDSNKEVIIDAVNASLRTPYAVTQSNYPN